MKNHEDINVDATNDYEKTRNLHYIKYLKKKIEDYKKLEKEYNKILSSLREYQYYEGEDERLHISPSAVKLIMNYLHHYGYDNSVEVIKNETGIGANTVNYKTLKQLLDKRDFKNAIIFTKEVYESKSTSENRFKSSYEDLLYILNKYLLLKLLQERKQREALTLFNEYICNHIKIEIGKGGSRAEWFKKDYKLLSTLININHATEIEKFNAFFNSWNWKKIIKQFWENGVKAYKSSYNLTKNNSSSQSFLQNSEDQTNIPLFSYVLAAYFLEDDELLDNGDNEISFKILDNINKFSKELKDISNMSNSKISENILDEDYDNKVINILDNNHMESRNKNLDSSLKNDLNNAFENLNLNSHVINSNSVCTISVSKRRSKSISTYRNVGNLSSESNNNSLNERRSKSLNTYRSMGNLNSESNNNSLNERRNKSLNTYRSVGNLSSESNNSSLNERKIYSSRSSQSLNYRKSKSLTNSFASLNNLSDSIESQDDKQNSINSNQFKGFVITNDMMKPEFGISKIARSSDNSISHLNQFSENESLPLVSNENETLDFRFSSCIGPMMGTIRALDIKVLPSTNQVIGVSASGDDRGDKKISLWDLNNSSLITQLNNKTSKTVLTLSFHPVWEDILLSSDMEFDVKLWNWKSGKLLKIWKKHHTRIIHKTEFIPDNYEMAVSCSSDQSIKIWNVTKDDSKITSIHSNEPFTSFTFYGEGHNQILVASLNYSLKLYKLRTSSFLHSINLEDLKSNKTPITSITSHPIQDNFILISSDNRLILFDLKTSTSLKTYCAREILPGQRIQGDFSPCGNYIYSGCADVKSFDLRKSYNLASSNSISNTNLMSLNNDDDCIDNSERDLNNVSGVFIWKLHTGKLERNSMSLMEESAFYKDIEIYPVTLCKWITINTDNDDNENNRRKVLISAGLDRCINVFSG